MTKKIIGIATILLLIAVIAIGAAKANTLPVQSDAHVPHHTVKANNQHAPDLDQLDDVDLSLLATNLRLTRTLKAVDQRGLAGLTVGDLATQDLEMDVPTSEVAALQRIAGLGLLDLNGLYL